MRYIWQYLKKYPKLLLLDFVGAMMFVVVNLGMPTILARVIDDALVPQRLDRLYYWIMIMVLIIVMGVVGRIVLIHAAGKLTTKMIQNMRNDLFAKLQQYSHNEYEQIGVSSLVTRITSDAFVLMQFAEQTLKMGVITPLMMITSIVMIVLTSPSLGWLVALAIPFLTIVIYYIGTKSKPLSEKQQQTLDKINQYVRENLTGLRVIRAFAREDYQEERFDSQNKEYAQTSNRLFKLMGLGEPLFVMLLITMIVLIIWFALPPLQRGELQVGSLVAFVEYSFHALFSFLQFALLFMMYPRMAVSAKRLQEIIDMPISIDPNEDGVTETKTQGYFENINICNGSKTD